MEPLGSDKFRLEVLYGSVELKDFKKFHYGKMVTYSYSITRDRNGVEVSRTEPTPIGSVSWGNDKPFTEKDYNFIKSQ